MLRASSNKVLGELIRHAATMSCVMNTQDAILVIKSLHSLQIRTNDVRRICEKASMSIAANPTETSVAVVIDAVNALASLQASNVKVVHTVLVKRFLELRAPVPSQTRNDGNDGGRMSAQQAAAATCTAIVNPKTVQKAAFALLKLGKKNVRADVAHHVFHLLVNSSREAPMDGGLHLALISVFSLLSEQWYELDGESRSALFAACTFVFGNNGIETKPCFADALKGNMVWQAMHFYVLYAQVALCDVSLMERRNELDGFFVDDEREDVRLDEWATTEKEMASRDELAEQRAAWLTSFSFFLRKRALHVGSMSAGSYAQFLSEHLEALWLHSPSRQEALAPLQNGSFFSRFNTYDVAKVAMALCNALERHPAAAEAFDTQGEVAAPPGAGIEANLQVVHVVFNCVVRIEKVLQLDAAFVKSTLGQSGHSFLLQRHGTALGSTWQLLQVVASEAAVTADGHEQAGWREKLEKTFRRLCRTTVFFLSCTQPDTALSSWLFNSMAKMSRTDAYGNDLDEMIHYLFENHIKPLRTQADAVHGGTSTGSDGGDRLLADCVKNLFSYTFLCTLSPLEMYALRRAENSTTLLAQKRTAKYGLDHLSMAAILVDHVDYFYHQQRRRMDGGKSTKLLADTLGIYLRELPGSAAFRAGDASVGDKVSQLTLSFLSCAMESTSKMSTPTLLSLVQCGLVLMGVPRAKSTNDDHATDHVVTQLVQCVNLLESHDLNFLQWSTLLFRLDAIEPYSPTSSPLFATPATQVGRHAAELQRCIVRGLCSTSASVNYTDGERPDFVAPQQWLHAAEVVRRRGAVLYMNVETYFLAARESRTETGNSRNDMFFVDVDAFLKRCAALDDAAVCAHLLRLIGEDYKMKGILPTKQAHIRSLLRRCLHTTEGEEDAPLSRRLCSVQCLVYLLNASTFLVRQGFLSVEDQERILECLHQQLTSEVTRWDCSDGETTTTLVADCRSAVQLLGALCEAEAFWQSAKQKCTSELVEAVKKAAMALGFSMAESTKLDEQMCALKVSLL